MFKSIAKAAVAATAVLAGAAQAADLKVGGKGFTEQLLIAEITTQYLESKGHSVEKIDGMGTSVVRAALENGQVDLYWEYTGTSLITFNKVEEKLDREATYAKVKELDAEKGITWLTPSAANNTYALAVRESDDKGLSSLSDLAAAYNEGKKVNLGVNAEFPKRSDGLPGLEKAYGFDIGRRDITPMQGGLIYQALNEGEIDAGLVFATDGRIAAFGFKVLADDKGFFPDYALTPTVRTEVLEANPELSEQLNALSTLITDDLMRSLNARVDVEKITIEDVATEFLTAQGLI
ncbi:glycine betaine ABC transporter substrate-binding protein [Epibacterium ulvae]|uniref:glycine betaine ABC transporter substrate-binding protein n=1 Tax=Epibacterium ulvae TaxID=1156985 RepID=UPI0024933168|nr:glycine betaine ABC transporter substrate-binding protein [Epibacterium ulvae]